MVSCPNMSASPSRSKWLLENVASLALALLIVFTIRSSIVEAFKIPSGSMIPTLLTGDHIFVNKFAYGLKVPFSDLFSDQPTFLIHRDPPKRGDIIVFKYPKDERVYFIKRVIGTPGDTIELRDKTLLINSKPIERAPVTGPVTVPANSLFVMGDNRDFSNDSRFWGFVPLKNVKGKAMVIWLSLWVSISDGQFIFRPDRIGTVLR
jgi:signal peptidase I